MHGSWVVEYQDGSFLAQYDAEHPTAIDGEVPYRAINWANVARVRFESQVATGSFDIPEPDPGYAWSLRSRHWMRPGGTTMSAFMIVASRAGQEVRDDTVDYVLFWFPDGTTHETPLFNSPDASQYGSGLVHGIQRSLMPATGQLMVTSDAVSS